MERPRTSGAVLRDLPLAYVNNSGWTEVVIHSTARSLELEMNAEGTQYRRGAAKTPNRGQPATA
jgi:hypothetical protein